MDITNIVKCAQLDLLIELKRICEKNNIKYFLVGGSLIGAIRHTGFIPWDDDIDVGMLRDDYERFVELARNDLNNDYELIDWHIIKKYPVPFMKLRIKGTVYKEELALKTDLNNGIFVDIFPIDDAPRNILVRKIQWGKCYFIRKAILLKCNIAIDENKGFVKSFLYKILKRISTIFDIEYLKKQFEINATKFNGTRTDSCVSYCGAYNRERETFPKAYTKETILHAFEEYQFSVPKEYDAFLKKNYGDYMKLPPLSEQKGKHGVFKVDLGKYIVKSSLRGSSNI